MNTQHKFEPGRSQNRLLAVWLLLSSLFLAAGWTRAETGVQAWVRRYNNVTDSYDRALKVVTDHAGNVIVAGFTYDGITGQDMLVIKYSSVGVPLWTNRYNGPANSDDQANAVAVDGSGNVFVTGDSYGESSSSDYATIAYSGTGVPLWTNRYNGSANGYDSPGGKQSLALGPDGSVYVAGASGAGFGGSDFATVKYVSVPVLTLEPDGSGGFFISVNGVPNVTYRLQRAPGVTGAWSDLATNTAPASGLIEYHETSPLPGQAFYRAVTS